MGALLRALRWRHDLGVDWGVGPRQRPAHGEAERERQGDVGHRRAQLTLLAGAHLYERIHQANVSATGADINLLDSISGLFKKQPGGTSNAD